MEDKGYFDSLGELLRKICTRKYGREIGRILVCTLLLDTKLLKTTLLNMYKSNVDGDDSEETS